MRLRNLVFFGVLFAPIYTGAASAASTTSLLQQSLSAMVGSAVINDLTLDGSVVIIEGSNRTTGTATLSGMVSGPSKITLNVSSGKRTETVDTYSARRTGTWTAPDGTVHSMALHNLWTTSSWFSPVLAISSALSTPNMTMNYVGEENLRGTAVQHVKLVWPSPADTAPEYARLTQLDFFLDLDTLLPVALRFNTHPDDNVLVDIPVEIRFADYRSLKGAQVPFKIQKYINNTLILDFEMQAATVNTGLTADKLTQ